MWHTLMTDCSAGLTPKFSGSTRDLAAGGRCWVDVCDLIAGTRNVLDQKEESQERYFGFDFIVSKVTTGDASPVRSSV